MADLKGDDRAQVLLVAGFVLAASFVALTLVLNSVIYTENLATRGADARGGDAISYRNDVAEGLEPIVEMVNRNGSSRSAIRNGLSRAVVSTSRRAAQFQVLRGVSANTTLASIDWGARIGQNRTGNFTNVTNPNSGPVQGDWTLATDVDGTRDARINVTDSGELNQATNDPLTLNISDGTDDWTVTVFNDGTAGTTGIEVTNSTGSWRCWAGEDPTIGLRAGTFDGTDCPALEFGAGVSPPYEISVENGRQFEGTYSLVVNASIDAGDIKEENYYDDPTDGRFALPAAYTATVHVEYRSTSLSYATDTRVQPGESDD